jgi:hypothetical protein
MLSAVAIRATADCLNAWVKLRRFFLGTLVLLVEQCVLFPCLSSGVHFTLPRTHAEIAEVLGMSEGSLIMRRGSFASLGGNGRLNHPAVQSRRIHERHKHTTNAELCSMALRVLEAKKG